MYPWLSHVLENSTIMNELLLQRQAHPARTVLSIRKRHDFVHANIFAETLTSINFRQCRNLQTLSALPLTLKSLSLQGSVILDALPPLPVNLTKLNLGQCRKLHTLPALPEGLMHLNLDGCLNLQFTAELMKRLKALEAKGCIIQYPNIAKTALFQCRFDTVIDSSSLSPAPEHIRRLLHLFMTKNVAQRGGATVLIQTLEPLIVFFEQDPQHLMWANDIASVFLTGCVNQPVQGWSEIAAWTGVAQAQTFEKKLEAARYVVVLESITAFVAEHRPGQAIEVEAANVLLRTIYEEYLAQGLIIEPWLGLSPGVAYADLVRPWFARPEIILAIQALKAEISGLSIRDIAKRLCQTQFCILWGTLAFSEKVQRIKTRYAERRENYVLLDELSHDPAMLPDILAGLGSVEKRIEFEHLQHTMAEQGVENILEHAQELVNEEQMMLTKKIQKWTNRLLAPKKRDVSEGPLLLSCRSVEEREELAARLPAKRVRL